MPTMAIGSVRARSTADSFASSLSMASRERFSSAALSGWLASLTMFPGGRVGRVGSVSLRASSSASSPSSEASAGGGAGFLRATGNGVAGRSRQLRQLLRWPPDDPTRARTDGYSKVTVGGRLCPTALPSRLRSSTAISESRPSWRKGSSSGSSSAPGSPSTRAANCRTSSRRRARRRLGIVLAMRSRSVGSGFGAGRSLGPWGHCAPSSAPGLGTAMLRCPPRAPGQGGSSRWPARPSALAGSDPERRVEADVPAQPDHRPARLGAGAPTG